MTNSYQKSDSHMASGSSNMAASIYPCCHGDSSIDNDFPPSGKTQLKRDLTQFPVFHETGN